MPEFPVSAQPTPDNYFMLPRVWIVNIGVDQREAGAAHQIPPGRSIEQSRNMQIVLHASRFSMLTKHECELHHDRRVPGSGSYVHSKNLKARPSSAVCPPHFVDSSKVSFTSSGMKIATPPGRRCLEAVAIVALKSSMLVMQPVAS